MIRIDSALAKIPFLTKAHWFPGLHSLYHAQNLPVVAHWRRIFILPSTAGWFFGATLLLMLMASLNFNNNLGLLLIFWLMGLLQVLLLATFLNLKDLSIQAIRTKPAHAGDTTHVTLILCAPSVRPGIQACWSDVGISTSPPGTCTATPEGGRIQLPLATRQRGLMPIPRLKVFTRHPAGLFTAWIMARISHNILVYPRAERKAPPWPLGTATEDGRWFHTPGEHFDGLRPYQHGDPLRLVAWKRSAQIQDLVSREYHDTRGQHITFDWSNVQHLPLEQALSRLTAWVVRADDLGLHYRLLMPDFDSGSGQGHQHRHRCLRSLALFRHSA